MEVQGSGRQSLPIFRAMRSWRTLVNSGVDKRPGKDLSKKLRFVSRPPRQRHSSENPVNVGFSQTPFRENIS